VNKNNDFKTFNSSINECKSKVDLINKIKISSTIANKKLMKSIIEKNSKKDKKLFKFNYNKQCIYKTKYMFHLKRHINSVHKKIKKFKCLV
jgi:hypothetical protein